MNSTSSLETINRTYKKSSKKKKEERKEKKKKEKGIEVERVPDILALQFSFLLGFINWLDVYSESGNH